MFKKFGILLSIQFFSSIIGCFVNLITSIALDSFFMSLCYYRLKLFIAGFYIINSMMASSICITYFMEYVKGEFLPIHINIQLILHSHGVCLAILALIELIMDTSYILTILSLCFYNFSMTLNELVEGLQYIPKLGKKLHHSKIINGNTKICSHF